jgi:hypothetical protein
MERNRDHSYHQIAVIAIEKSNHEIKESKQLYTPAMMKAYEFANQIVNRDLKAKTLKEVEKVFPSNFWDSIRQKIDNLKSDTGRNQAYKRFAEIAAEKSHIEINTSVKKSFYSPAAIKAYGLASKISCVQLRKETLQNVEKIIAEDFEELGVLINEGGNMSDLQLWDDALQATNAGNWELAEGYLEQIQDSFFKDEAYSAVVLALAHLAETTSKDEESAIRETSLAFLEKITSENKKKRILWQMEVRRKR